MSASQVWLQADGNISEQDMGILLVALDHQRSPKVNEIQVDYDGINEEQVNALIPAITHTSIPYFQIAFTQIDPALSERLFAATSQNQNITYSWLLLGSEHFYYRGDVIEDDELLQIFHQKVTLNLESMTDEQLTLLINQLTTHETKELSLKITNMEAQVVQHVTETLRKIPSITKMSLSLGEHVTTVGQDIGDEFIEQFAALMQETKEDFTDLATTASGYANSLLMQGKSWLNALTTPMAACFSVAPEIDEEQKAELKRQEKAAVNKLA